MAEADESDGSFLMYAPDVAVVTNVEADHLDNYGTEQAYRASFAAFLARIKPGGLLVTSADDPGAKRSRRPGPRPGTAGRHVRRVTRRGLPGHGVTTSGMETTFPVTGRRRGHGPEPARVRSGQSILTCASACPASTTR